MAKIVILEHELQRGLGLPYMVHAFAERWQALGHSVVWHYGTENLPPGDVAILHVDLTVTPRAYRALRNHYPRVINGEVLDISKRRFSQQLLARDDAWAGAVIVKTDANFFGRPEHLLRARAQQARRPAEFDVGPALAGYPIYRHLADVPETAWRTRGLIVEKFLPERDEKGLFCLHVWTFLGERETCSLWRSNEAVIKATNTVERGPSSVPEPLRDWRARLRFDFGKFDYVVHEGAPVLLDVNRSPSFPRVVGGTAARVVETLAPGIDDFLSLA
jgi:hypothetical protein